MPKFRLLRLREVMQRTGKSRSALYRDRTFPRPLKIGPRATAWREDEIEEWIARQIANRDKGEEVEE